MSERLHPIVEATLRRIDARHDRHWTALPDNDCTLSYWQALQIAIRAQDAGA